MRMSELAIKVVQSLLVAIAFICLWIPSIAIWLQEWRKRDNGGTKSDAIRSATDDRTSSPGSDHRPWEYGISMA